MTDSEMKVGIERLHLSADPQRLQANRVDVELIEGVLGNLEVSVGLVFVYVGLV